MNPITPSIDFQQDGIQHGFLRLPYSRNDSAWGSVMIPIYQYKNGDGPTVLITGGSHGDEYEGPIALHAMATAIDIAAIRGRAIVVPAMNYPAFCVGTRVSPIDNLNLNRIFPGRANGRVTEQIADYFSHNLLPLADYVLDLHSGGKTLDFVPFAAIHLLDNKAQQEINFAAMQAFAAPYQTIMQEIDAAGLYDTQAEAMGKVFVTAELGGAGTTTPASVAIARRGVRNFLIHAGVLQDEPEPLPQNPVLVDSTVENAFMFSEHNGLIHPLVALGDRVKKDDLVAQIYSHERTGKKPYNYLASRDGMIICRHVPSLVKAGDCMNVIAEVVES